MRVVAGTLKGRNIKAVKGTNTRPTTDKVKENIFNIIGPYFDGGIALDLFGGSGNLGIESLSRGIERVIFVDKESIAINTIKENVKELKIDNQVEIYRNDYLRALKALVKRDIQFDLIFTSFILAGAGIGFFLSYIVEVIIKWVKKLTNK